MRMICVNLPTNLRDTQGRVHKPDRLQDNIDSGYALWVEWDKPVTRPGSSEGLRRGGEQQNTSGIDCRRSPAAP